MKNFCPNCGKTLKPGDKFCPACGHVMQNNETYAKPVQLNTAVVSIQAKVENSKAKSKIGVLTSLFVICLLVIASVGGYIYYQNGPKVVAAVDKMSTRQIAGLAVEYAHIHYKDNLTWNEVYHEALQGNLAVEKYKQYEVGNSVITAKGGNDVYVINQKVIFTTDKNMKNSQSLLALSDGKRQLGKISTLTAYKDIQKNNELSQLQKIDNLK